MSSYKAINNIVGWVIFIIALVTYTMTLEATASFWDCGEFILGAYKLQVVHPPGAPLFLIVGRFFTLFALDTSYVAWTVNFLSGLTSAFSVLFLFWITTALIKRVLVPKGNPGSNDTLVIMVAGIIAGLCCTFLDTIWFSAVEGEVYAMSLFFIMIVVWAMIRWNSAKSQMSRDRWLVMIFFLIGVSSGVHLMSLLALPSMALMYYLKTLEDKSERTGKAVAPSWKVAIAFTALGLGMLFFVYKGIITGTVTIMKNFEMLLVNGLGMGFNTGVIVSGVLLAGTIIAGIYFTSTKDISGNNSKIIKVLLAILAALYLSIFFSPDWVLGARIALFVGKVVIFYFAFAFGSDSLSFINTALSSKRFLNLFFVCLAMLYIGYSTYAVVPIRANANTPINMNRPGDVVSLESYLNREQYGDRPLLYGPHFMARRLQGTKDNGPRYHQDEASGEYIVVGRKFEYKFNKNDMMLFPRIGHLTRPDHKRAYIEMMGLKENEMPTMGDNISFFVNYQLGFMYARYFMWNFSGRQDDVQGRFDNNRGRFLTGVNFIDEFFVGDQDLLPDNRRENKSRNIYYMIPLLLGLVGLFFHFTRDPWWAFSILILFFFTGILQAVYLNSPPFEPRERDYTLVASFVTYCIWIGFGVVSIYEFFKAGLKLPFTDEGLMKKGLGTIPAIAITGVICLSAPILMGTQNWDDHDRSDKYLALDFATNYLESCAPNAIIFTQGDNDTYPLWYAQEVDSVRTDVRVVNLSLLGVDWYIEGLNYAQNDAAKVKLTHTTDKYVGSRRDITVYQDKPKDKFKPNKHYDLKKVIEYVADDDPNTLYPTSTEQQKIYIYPTQKFFIPVDKQAVIENKMVPEKQLGRVVDKMQWTMNKTQMQKPSLIILDIVANNLMERPIYFATSVSGDNYCGLQKFFQLEGLGLRIVPVENSPTVNEEGKKVWRQENARIAVDVMYDNLMNKFKWGGIERKDTIDYQIESGRTIEEQAFDLNVTMGDLKAWNPDNDLSGGTIKVVQPVFMHLDDNTMRMTYSLRLTFIRLIQQMTKPQRTDEDNPELKAARMEKARKLVLHYLESLPIENVPFRPFEAYTAVFTVSALYDVGETERAVLLSRKIQETMEQEFNYICKIGEGSPRAKRSAESALQAVGGLLNQAEINGQEEYKAELNPIFVTMQGKLTSTNWSKRN